MVHLFQSNWSFRICSDSTSNEASVQMLNAISDRENREDLPRSLFSASTERRILLNS